MAEQRGVAPEGYEALLGDLKERIRGAQIKAALAVNRELIQLYWQVGRAILERQARHGWGTQVIDRLAADLHQAFPDMKGFSSRNLRYMRAFAAAFPDPDFLQQVAANLPWGHTMRLLDAVDDSAERAWYMREAIAHGWSRAVLSHHVDAHLYQRQGHAPTNFERTLPAAQSDLAQQVIKDPYNFEFLTLGPDARERDIERGLLAHIQHFLLELGVGFAFLGNQYRIEVRERDYYIDLLFYHVRLHCYVVVEVKAVEFDPAFAGTMNFYLSAVDDLLRSPIDQPSIGIILCKARDRVMVEYALRDLSKPIGVSEYQFLEVLPENLQESLPTVEELEATLGDVGDDQP